MQFVDLSKKVKRRNIEKFIGILALIIKVRKKINACHCSLLTGVTRQCSRRRHTPCLQLIRQFAAFFLEEKGWNFRN